MRRLVGLIALLVLILGAAWLARNDFDLNRIAEFDTLFKSADDGGTPKEPTRDVASAPASETAPLPEASQSETEVKAPSGEATESTVGADSEPAGTAEPFQPAEEIADSVPPEAEQMAAAEPAAPEAESEMTPEAPSADAEVDTAMVGPADEVDTEVAIVVPSFDIVRVEPTGDTVIAGLAEPQAMVEVLNGTEPVATAEANERGEWALVLEEPLPPGTHDLAIRTTSQDRSLVTLSDQRVAVSVPESADEEPLVVLNEPHEPSRVIQLPTEAEVAAAPDAGQNETLAEAMPESSASSGEADIAMPPSEPTPETEMPSAGETEVAAAPETEPTSRMSSSGEAEMATSPGTAASDRSTEAAAGETEVAVAPEAEPPSAMPSSSTEGEMTFGPSEAEPPAAAMETPGAETEVAVAPEPTPMAEPSMPSGGSEGAAPPSAMASATEGAAGAVDATADSSPTEETETAVLSELEAAASSDLAGSAPPSAAPSAEAGSEAMAAAPGTAADGTMSAGAPVGGGEDTSSAMVETVGEAPSSSERAPPTEMAAVPPSSEEEPAAEEMVASEPPAPAEPEVEPPAVVEAPPPLVPEVGVAAVEAETNGALYIAGTATTPEPVRVYVDDEFLGEATPTESGTWLLETTREMAPDEYTIRADQVEAGSGTVVARAEVPFLREIDVATLKPVGESVDPGTAALSGRVADPMTVIIKRGDNLWRISRKLYGRGIRYSTIYQANRDQIRNPDLIYPGQVFVLPVGDTGWETQ